MKPLFSKPKGQDEPLGCLNKLVGGGEKTWLMCVSKPLALTHLSYFVVVVVVAFQRRLLTLGRCDTFRISFFQLDGRAESKTLIKCSFQTFLCSIFKALPLLFFPYANPVLFSSGFGKERESKKSLKNGENIEFNRWTNWNSTVSVCVQRQEKKENRAAPWGLVFVSLSEGFDWIRFESLAVLPHCLMPQESNIAICTVCV